MIRELRWTDMENLTDSCFSFYSEVEAQNPDIGVVMYSQRPSYESEVGWFTNLYRDTMCGNAIAFFAEEGGRAVGICDIRRECPGSELSHKGALGIVIRKGYGEAKGSAQI